MIFNLFGCYNINFLSRLPDDMVDFCLETYIPEARRATTNVLPLPDEEKTKLRGNLFSTLIKLIYAFLWQVILINN